MAKKQNGGFNMADIIVKKMFYLVENNFLMIFEVAENESELNFFKNNIQFFFNREIF